jgi:predicted ATP-grasp superfamily ATP-dependent carboligase
VIGSDYKSLGVVRSLGRHGIQVWVLGDDHLLASWSRYARRRFRWPEASDEDGKVRYLLDLAQRYELDGWALFPTDDHTAALLTRHRDALAERYRLTILVPWETLRWAYDKRLTYRLAKGVGVDHPRTFYPRSRQDVLTFGGDYPAILKPASAAIPNAYAVPKAWSAPDREALVARYDEARTLIDPNLIMIQEFIPGGGESQLSYAALCRNGQPIASLVARRARQWPMDFGRASTYVETVNATDIEEQARAVLAALRFDGLVEVEFKRDPRDGRCKLLDINARVWGWHTLGRRAGVDFPYLLWLMLYGVAVPELRGQPGIRWVRALTDLPVALGEIRAGRLSVQSYLGSLVGPIEFAVLAADDPLPAILEVPAAAFLAWRRRRKPTERSLRAFVSGESAAP